MADNMFADDKFSEAIVLFSEFGMNLCKIWEDLKANPPNFDDKQETLSALAAAGTVRKLLDMAIVISNSLQKPELFESLHNVMEMFNEKSGLKDDYKSNMLKIISKGPEHKAIVIESLINHMEMSPELAESVYQRMVEIGEKINDK